MIMKVPTPPQLKWALIMKAIVDVYNNVNDETVGGIDGLKESLDNYLNAPFWDYQCAEEKAELLNKINYSFTSETVSSENIDPKSILAAVSLTLSIVKTAYHVEAGNLSPEFAANYIMNQTFNYCEQNIDGFLEISEDFVKILIEKHIPIIKLVLPKILKYVDKGVRAKINDGMEQCKEYITPYVEKALVRLEPKVVEKVVTVTKTLVEQ